MLTYFSTNVIDSWICFPNICIGFFAFMCIRDRNIIFFLNIYYQVVNIKDISMSSMIWEAEKLLGEPVPAPGEIVLSK